MVGVRISRTGAIDDLSVLFLYTAMLSILHHFGFFPQIFHPRPCVILKELTPILPAPAGRSAVARFEIDLLELFPGDLFHVSISDAGPSRLIKMVFGK